MPEPQLVSIPSYSQVRDIEEFPHSVIDKGIDVSVCVEFNGECASKEDMEKAGFYSIVTAE